MKQYIKTRRDSKIRDLENSKFSGLQLLTFRALQPSTVRMFRIDEKPYKNINGVKYCNLGAGNIYKISTVLNLDCNHRVADSYTLHESLQLKPFDNLQGRTFENITKRKQIFQEHLIDMPYNKLEGILYMNIGMGNEFYYNLVAQLDAQQFIKDGLTYEEVGEKTYAALNAGDYYPLQFVRNFKYYNVVNI